MEEGKLMTFSNLLETERSTVGAEMCNNCWFNNPLQNSGNYIYHGFYH
jgi:hypothetical protein